MGRNPEIEARLMAGHTAAPQFTVESVFRPNLVFVINRLVGKIP